MSSAICRHFRRRCRHRFFAGIRPTFADDGVDAFDAPPRPTDLGRLSCLRPTGLDAIGLGDDGVALPVRQSDGRQLLRQGKFRRLLRLRRLRHLRPRPFCHPAFSRRSFVRPPLIAHWSSVIAPSVIASLVIWSLVIEPLVIISRPRFVFARRFARFGFVVQLAVLLFRPWLCATGHAVPRPLLVPIGVGHDGSNGDRRTANGD